MGSDDEDDINDGMTMMLHHERGKLHPKILTRPSIHLWTIVPSFEDGRYKNIFMRVVLTS